MKPSRDISGLLEIMAALRTPHTGCPWDLEQNFATIAPYTIEEAYEVADAIARGDLADLRDELGDLLLQVVFHARMAQEQGAFAFGDVVQAITEKMLRRHPHVFGDADARRPDAVKGLWERIKAEEKAARAAQKGAAAPDGALAGVPTALPAMMRAQKLQTKAGQVGFDWNDPQAVLAKIREETEEVANALARGDQAAAGQEVVIGIGTPRAFADAGLAAGNGRALGCRQGSRAGQPRRKRADLITNPRCQPSAFP
jgi:ATP diphosphatase